MKSAKVTPTRSGRPASRHRFDWLTLFLICAAFVMIAIAAIGVDCWLSRSSDNSLTEVLGLTQPTASPTATPTVMPSPTPTPTQPLTPTLTPTAVTPPPCVPPDDWTIHLVEEGNTLYSLGRRYGTDVYTLKLVNCLNTDTIFIGQRLYVPGPPPTAVVTPEEIVAQQTPIPTLPVTATVSTPRPAASGTPISGCRGDIGDQPIQRPRLRRPQLKVNIPPTMSISFCSALTSGPPARRGAPTA